MENVEIRFTSDHITNKTNYRNLTQDQIMKELEDSIKKKEILSVTIDDEKTGEKRFIFPVMAEKINPVTNKREWKHTGTLIIVADKSVCRNNANVARLEQLAKKVGHVSYSNNARIKKIGKVVLAVTTTAVIVVGAVKGFEKGIEEFVEWDNANYEAQVQSITEQYKDANGNDVRANPSYSDTGYFVQDETGKYYIDEQGNKYIIDNNGNYHLVETQIDINEEEKGKTF